MSGDPTSMRAPHPSDAQAVIDTAMMATTPKVIEPGEVYAIIEPPGGRVQRLDTELYLPHPKRERGTTRPDTVAALMRYTDRHKTDALSVWVDRQGTIVSVLNDHEGAGLDAGWGDHRAELVLRPTPEWNHWVLSDGKMMSQEEFAEHLEDGQAEVIEPDASTMLEVASTFHATSSASFRQATRLENGTVAMKYDQEQRATAGTSGELSVPQKFTLGITPYLGEDRYKLTARLRWRLREGRLTIGYRLERPHLVIDACLSAIGTRLAEQYPGHVYAGTPRIGVGL